MTESRTVKPNEDPVCGMAVDVAQARTRGLTMTHHEHEYAFCGKGCLLEFRDDPKTYLAPHYSPSM